ncbi:MAG: lytic transglycosylase domain-containing protein [Treponema sp.]|nr:lytic transglycosylase domain-containing protein [Treponema sp.]
MKRPKLRPIVFYSCSICLLPLIILPFFSGSKKNNQESHEAEEYVFKPEMYIPPVYMREKQDIILLAYRDAMYRDMVETFFEGICGSRELAETILANASEFDISPALAFSLCWEESRYYYRAVNRKNRNSTVDRGLFQLNNASFPHLKEDDFFDPNTNAWYGLSHLRWCLDHAGTEVAGIAMYNAGTGRVRSGGTPKATLDYISRIINRQREIEELFLSGYSRQEEADVQAEPEKKIDKLTLSLLAPLGGR